MMLSNRFEKQRVPATGIPSASKEKHSNNVVRLYHLAHWSYSVIESISAVLDLLEERVFNEIVSDLSAYHLVNGFSSIHELKTESAKDYIKGLDMAQTDLETDTFTLESVQNLYSKNALNNTWKVLGWNEQTVPRQNDRPVSYIKPINPEPVPEGIGFKIQKLSLSVKLQRIQNQYGKLISGEMNSVIKEHPGYTACVLLTRSTNYIPAKGESNLHGFQEVLFLLENIPDDPEKVSFILVCKRLINGSSVCTKDLLKKWLLLQNLDEEIVFIKVGCAYHEPGRIVERGLIKQIKSTVCKLPSISQCSLNSYTKRFTVNKTAMRLGNFKRVDWLINSVDCDNYQTVRRRAVLTMNGLKRMLNFEEFDSFGVTDLLTLVFAICFIKVGYNRFSLPCTPCTTCVQ
jgi:hypothetical protein